MALQGKDCRMLISEIYNCKLGELRSIGDGDFRPPETPKAMIELKFGMTDYVQHTTPCEK